MTCFLRHEWDESNGWRYCRHCPAAEYWAISGQWVSPDEGAPSAERIAEGLRRLGRLLFP